MSSPGPRRSPSPSGSEDNDDSKWDNNGAENAQGGTQNNGAPSSKKDPSRPKRKKARRACLACQRAHLTCGDERPCQRCIKRGLQDTCHDGVRKKAKYLHDAPAEALAPGIIDDFAITAHRKHSLSARSTISEDQKMHSPQNFLSRTSSAAVTHHGALNQGGVNAEMQNNQLNPYTTQQSPSLHPQYASQHTSPMQTFSTPAHPPPTINVQGYGGQFFDPGHPLYNLNISDMNFGNEYGALEFGMLGHMSSTAPNGPFLPGQHSRSSSNANFDGQTFNAGFAEDPIHFSPSQSHQIANWQMNQPNHGFLINPYNASIGGGNPQFFPGSQEQPNAYAIGTGPNGYQAGSPESQRSDPLSVGEQPFATPGQRRSSRQQNLQQRSSGNERQPRQQPSTPKENAPSDSVSQKLHSMSTALATNSKKQRRNPTQIYSSITKPYPYTMRFHALTAVLQRRFSSQKRLAIARALASIRPSFISCTRTLVEDDLIFMEKSFQRALLEYEDVVSAVGTPTIVCRRTGEVTYAGTEFSLLTGWSRDVLLGKEPNLNINTGWSEDGRSGSMSGTTSRGVNTPAIPATAEHGATANSRTSPQTESRPQPVFLAELLDDETVVQFYEDFAKLAFADKGSVWSPCKVLKYVTKEQHLLNLSHSLDANKEPATTGSTPSAAIDQHYLSAGTPRSKRVNSSNSQLAVDEQVKKVRDKNSKVDCVYCWTVRRDFFNMPMMIVLNFLPIM